MRDVFVAYFADSIKFCGDTHEISERAMAAQLWEVRNDGKHSPAWKQVYLETEFHDPYGYWSVTKMDLLATALDLGIDLFMKTTEDKTKVFGNAGTRMNRIKTKRKIQNEDEDSDTITEYEGETDKEDPLYFTIQTPRFGLLTPVSCSKSSKTLRPQAKINSYQSPISARHKSNMPYIGSNISTMLPSSPCERPLAGGKLASLWNKRTLTFENDMVFRFYDDNCISTHDLEFTSLLT